MTLGKTDGTQTQLKALLQKGGMSGEDTRRCRTLLNNLDRPPRIAVIGPNCSGKTTVLNSLLGGPVLPEVSTDAVLEISTGDDDHYSFNVKGNWTAPERGVVETSQIPAECDHIRQSLSLPELAGRQYMEITLPEAKETQSRALDQLTTSADIVLMCARDLSGAAFDAWSKIPDSLKDHSFLVLTFADELLANGTLEQKTECFNQDHADNFMCLYPVAAKHALSVRRNGVITDRNLWKASGCSALFDGLEREIRAGKQADMDNADVLLAKYANLINSDGDAKAADLKSGALRVERPSSSRQRPEALSPMKRSEAIATALTVLQAPVDEMLRDIENDTPQAAHVLDHTTQAAQALATLFMDTSTDDQHLNSFRDSVLEYEQMAILLQQEGTETAAHDAVTGLLQLKKEMSEVAYA